MFNELKNRIFAPSMRARFAFSLAPEMNAMKDSTSKRLWAFLLLVLFSQGLFAQANIDSPYSMFGIGQVRDKVMNCRLRGMGGVANAVNGKTTINPENPASYAMIDSLAFLFDAGMYFKSATFSTSSLSEKSNNANFDYVAMAFGLTRWWKMSLGAQPYSNVGYNLAVDGYKEDVGHYSTAFQGKGGLNQVFWGNAFRLGKHFAVGANAKYVFGDMESWTTLSFPDTSDMIGTRRGTDIMVSSFMFDYGVLYNGKVSDDMSLSIGATYNQKVRLSGDQTTFIRSIEANASSGSDQIVDTIFYSQMPNAHLTMPQGFGLGFVLHKNNRWSIGADFNWTQWSQFSRDGASDSLCNSWRVAIGGEYLPKSSSVSNYFTKASYRCGAFYEQTYLCVNGHKINKFGVTAGISLPLPKTLSKVNVGLELGQCGTKSFGLIQEHYFNVNVGVSVFERWFVKRRYR